MLNDSLLGDNKPFKDATGVEYCDAMIAEILSKQLAFTENIDKKTIKLPVKKGDSYKLVEYKITKKEFGDSLPYFILEPISDPDAKPWITVRGTHLGDSEGAKESVFADVTDSRNIDMSPLKEREQEIQEKFKELRDRYKKGINLSGHSLGGAFVQQLAVDYCNGNDTVIALDAPGISREACETFKKKARTEQASVAVLCGENDVVPKAGQKHLGAVYL
jgi:hypothetical protein